MIEMNEAESLSKCRNAQMCGKIASCKGRRDKQNGNLITGSAPAGIQVT